MINIYTINNKGTNIRPLNIIATQINRSNYTRASALRHSGFCIGTTAKWPDR